MKRTLLLLATVVLASCGNNNTPLHEAKEPGVYVKQNVKTEKDWYEGFDSLDSWNILDEGGYKAHGRQQYYTPDNVSIENGVLTLKTKPTPFKGYNFTSGAVTTKDKQAFLYGKLEVEAKFPSGQGLMPAIWLLPVSGDPLPEIDIAEVLGQQTNLLYNVVHWNNGKKRRSFNDTSTIDLSSSFHTYGIDWNEDRIVFTLDGEVTHVSNYSPDVPMYLYLNTAVGGVWAGDPYLTNEVTFEIKRVLYSRS